MPNWCNNNIEITGPISKVGALYKQAIQDADDETGLLNAMRPMPEILRDTTSPTPENIDEVQKNVMLAQTGATNWYDWCVSNWSTKWEVSSEGLEYTEDTENGTATLSGWFDSAWAPPINAMAYYGENNPDVSIVLDYYEPGMCFVGRYTIENGLDNDEYYEYSEATSKTVRALIGEDMDDMWCISENMAEWEEENQEENAE